MEKEKENAQNEEPRRPEVPIKRNGNTERLCALVDRINKLDGENTAALKRDFRAPFSDSPRIRLESA